MALGTVALAYDYFAKVDIPIQVVTTVFFLDFLIRVTAGLKYSPMGILARWMTRRQPHGERSLSDGAAPRRPEQKQVGY